MSEHAEFDPREAPDTARESQAADGLNDQQEPAFEKGPARRISEPQSTHEGVSLLADTSIPFRELIEESTQGILIHRAWKPLFVNAAYARILGYDSPEEILAQPSIEAHIPSYERERRRRYRDARLAGIDAPEQYEVDAVRKDGRIVTLQNIVRVVQWEGFPAIQNTVVDVTARRRTEDQLRWSEQRFRDFTRAASDWFWETDADIRFTFVSERLTDITGLGPEYYIGKSPAAFAETPHGNISKAWISHTEDLRHRRAFRDFTYSVKGSNGRRRHVRINGVPVFDDDGGFMGYRGTGVDITAEVQAAERMRTAEARFIEALESISDGYALFDAEDRLVVCNSIWREQLDQSERELAVPGIRFETLLRTAVERGTLTEAPGDKEAWILERLARHRRGGQPFEVRRGKDVRHLVREFNTPDGGTVLVVSDISELKRRERAVIESERRFRDFAETAADWFWEMNAELRFTYLSERYYELTGLSRTDTLGLTRRELLARRGLDVSCFEEHFRALEARQPFRAFEFETILPSGDRRVHSISGKPIFGDDGEFLGYRGTGRDVTRAHRLARQMAYQASHDALTGLVNRRELEARLRRVVDTVRDFGGEHALCYLDLDQFKVINDSCGHLAGDQLLRQLSAALRARVRKRDTLARLGGDEFGLLMEHCSLGHAQRAAEALRGAVEEFRFIWEDKSFNVAVSIGLVSIVGDEQDVDEILGAADRACYIAKERGRNRIHVYRRDDADLTRHRGEMQWLGRINRGLEEGRFFLVYQPIVPVAEAATDSAAPLRRFELLLQLRDESGKEISPGAFLPAAERYGLATRLDRWVVKTAFGWLDQYRGRLPDLEACSINLSGHSLGDPAFLDFVSASLDEFCLPPELICFEITETATIGNLPGATRFLGALSGRGCRFALDDFGSGLSSFAYLKTLPVQYLKIDGAFVRGIARDPIDLAMVRSINDVGRVMGKHTIAEFVESEAVLRKLREIGVDYAQGHHVGRPRPLAHLET